VLDGSSARLADARSVFLTGLAAALLVAAAYGFVRSALRDRKAAIAGMLGGSSVLLAAAWIYDLVSPGLTATSISGREILRVGALALILRVALKCREQVRRARTGEVAAGERRRVIRDLHDGMAQDLAFIVMHGQRLAPELGPDHPLLLAAGRALSASRGLIADLSATDAPTTGEALRAVAAELSERHNVDIEVAIDGDELTAEDREEVVRIAREAIVNAITHGRAKNIFVFLTARGAHLRLTVRDDGTGLRELRGEGARGGYGLRAMQQRAEAIGGRLAVRAAPTGGTAVEVSVW
jgi:signal transduction histidine kinase